MTYKHCGKCEHKQECAYDCVAFKPSTEQTNEEWFCSLSTEDKAKWLSQRSQILYDCGQRDVFPETMYEEDWEWWLKQPHGGES